MYLDNVASGSQVAVQVILSPFTLFAAPAGGVVEVVVFISASEASFKNRFCA
jgi:hypothetical protein